MNTGQAHDLFVGLAYSGVGGVIGFVLGTTYREWWTRQRGERGGRRPLDRLWNVLGVIALGLLALSWIAGYRVNTCQADANRAFAERISYLQEASAVERRANRIERDAWRQAFRTSPTAGQAERQAAAAQIKAALDEADRLIVEADARRAAAPPPEAGLRDCS